MHRCPHNPNSIDVSSARGVCAYQLAHAQTPRFFTPLKIDAFLPHDYYMIIFGASHW